MFGERNKTQQGRKDCKKHGHTNKLFGAAGDEERGRVGGTAMSHDRPEPTAAACSEPLNGTLNLWAGKSPAAGNM